MIPSPGPPRSSSALRRRRRKRRKGGRFAVNLPHFATALLLLLISPGNAQFGEIASVITSLLASGGGGAGLAGLGAGAGGLAGLGSAAGTGASLGAASAGTGAIGNIGSLYQLAQAALQLTGTGVGIANQASESAWFPAVVESASKMHKDFQDRLLSGAGAQGGGLGGATKTRGRAKGGSSGGIGKEYGLEFGSGEEGAAGGGTAGGGDEMTAENGLGGLLGGGLPAGPDPFSSSRLPLLPNLLLPMGGPSPAPTTSLGRMGGTGGLPGLPGLGRLLPGEWPGGEGGMGGIGTNGRAGIGTDGTIASGKKLIGIGTIEEVPLSPPTAPEAAAHGTAGVAEEGEAAVGHSVAGLLPGEVGPSPLQPIPSPSIAGAVPISSPKITVQLPDSVEASGTGGSVEAEGAKNGKKAPTIEQIETEFSTDNEGGGGGRGEGNGGTGPAAEEEAEHGLEPLIPLGASARLEALNMTQIEQIAEARGLAQMVPELRKLIGQLKMGNLTGAELDELESQLAGNAGAGEPRENAARGKTAGAGRSREEEEEEDGEAGRRSGEGTAEGGSRQKTRKGQPVNEKRERASQRNLAALRRGLHSAEWEEGGEGEESPPDEGRRRSEEKEGAEEAGDEEEEKKGEEEEEVLVDGQRDPILRKIVDFNRPPVILSLERPNGAGHHRLGSLLGSPHGHRVENGGREKARAFGAASERIEGKRAEIGGEGDEGKGVEGGRSKGRGEGEGNKGREEGGEEEERNEEDGGNGRSRPSSERPSLSASTGHGTTTIDLAPISPSSTITTTTGPTSIQTTRRAAESTTKTMTTTPGAIEPASAPVRAKIPYIPAASKKAAAAGIAAQPLPVDNKKLLPGIPHQPKLSSQPLKLIDAEVENEARRGGGGGRNMRPIGADGKGGGGRGLDGQQRMTQGQQFHPPNSVVANWQNNGGGRQPGGGGGNQFAVNQFTGGPAQQQNWQQRPSQQNGGGGQQQLKWQPNNNWQQPQHWGGGSQQQGGQTFGAAQFNIPPPSLHHPQPQQQPQAQLFGQQNRQVQAAGQFGQTLRQQPQHQFFQQHPQQWPNQQQQQQFPFRTLPDPAQSTPPSLIYHPFSSGTLLTLGQSQQQQRPEFFRFGRK